MGKGKGKRDSEPSNLYERGGVWYARVQVDGRDERRSLKTRSYDEAKRRLAAFLLENSPYHGTTRRSFPDAAAGWIETHAGNLKPKTRRRYDSSLGLLLPHFEHLFWDQITKSRIQEFVDARRKQGAKPATINRDLTVLSNIANYVIDADGGINPVSLLPKKQRQEKRATFVMPPPDQIEAVLGEMSPAFRRLCEFSRATGTRKDEAVFLERWHVREDAADIWETKNRLSRTIKLNEAARAVVASAPEVPGCPYVFVTRNKGHFKRATEMFREAWLKAQKSAQAEGRKLVKFTLHGLRHIYAIDYLRGGGNLYLLQQQLGHGSIRQTEWYLRFLTPEQALRAKHGPAQ